MTFSRQNNEDRYSTVVPDKHVDPELQSSCSVSDVIPFEKAQELILTSTDFMRPSFAKDRVDRHSESSKQRQYESETTDVVSPNVSIKLRGKSDNLLIDQDELDSID